MEAVATTGLYPSASKTQAGSEIDAKYGLLQLAARAASPSAITSAAAARTSFPPGDSQQQLVHRGPNNARTSVYGQAVPLAGGAHALELGQLVRREDIGKALLNLSMVDSIDVVLNFSKSGLDLS